MPKAIRSDLQLERHTMIDAKQAWFWTTTWQAREREADVDRDAGRVENFSSGADLLRGLESLVKQAALRRTH